MIDKTNKNDSNNVGTVNPVIAGIAGMIAGGVAVATALVMSDKKNQTKVKKTLTDIKGRVTDYAKNVQEQVQDTGNGIGDKLTKGGDRVKKIIGSVKDSVENETKEVGGDK